MSAGTKIQWCDATVNFWWGCAKVSDGCRYCYAEGIARRLSRGTATWGENGLRRLRVGEATRELLQLNKRAERQRRTLRVFINSMSDTFENRRDLDAARHVLWAVARVVPALDLLLLTKRPENVRHLVDPEWMAGKWPANVWLGTTVENQAAADERIPHLLAVPAPVRWLSCEPLLGPVDIRAGDARPPGMRGYFDWVVAGGESGQQARPCKLDWLRSLRNQCDQAGVPFFLKQLGRRPCDIARPVGMCPRKLDWLCLRDSHGGDPMEWPALLRVRQFPVRQTA